MKKEEIFEYVQNQYGTIPEYLWSKLPDSAVLRHKNGKWYAVIMTVEKSKLHWITILLDGSVSEAKILDFLDMSYDLIDGAGRKENK